MQEILNSSAYQFIAVQDTDGLRADIFTHCEKLNLKGTVLIADEGINLNLAGAKRDIDSIETFFLEKTPFKNLDFKHSFSRQVPYSKLAVKVRDEIITLGVESLEPSQLRQNYVTPKQLKKWLDEKHNLILFDARNIYETRLGTFKNAVTFKIRNFREFPEALHTFTKQKQKIVMFCTGGIRCEKASAYMLKEGYEEVLQLQGGILKYFEECGNAHWDGECFVFDDRVTINHKMEATYSELCTKCQRNLNDVNKSKCDICVSN